MTTKDKKIYKGFGKRLMDVAKMRGLGDTGAIAKAIYSDKRCKDLFKVRKHKEYENPYDEIETIRRNIQNHLSEKYVDACKVDSRHMYVYSIILDCSLDYLYGKSTIMSADLEVGDICNKTGLTEEAVIKLVDSKEKNEFIDDRLVGSVQELLNSVAKMKGENCVDDLFTIYRTTYSEWWSELMSGDSFKTLPNTWSKYADLVLETITTKESPKNELTPKELASSIRDMYPQLKDKFSDEEIINSISGPPIDADEEHRKKEEAKYGAFYVMIQCVENFLTNYAEEWADKNHNYIKEKENEIAHDLLKILKDMN